MLQFTRCVWYIKVKSKKSELTKTLCKNIILSRPRQKKQTEVFKMQNIAKNYFSPNFDFLNYTVTGPTLNETVLQQI